MSKIKYFVFTILLSIFLIPNVFAKGIVEIESIELDSKSENAIVNSVPTFDGLKMDFDISFKAKDDFVKYKVVIKNDTDTDYKISDDTSFNKSEYITYSYDVDEELKAGSTTIVYVTITYTKEVDDSALVDNKYIETNRAVVQLKNEVDNPNTGDKSIAIILVSVMILAFVTLIVLNKRSSFKYSSFVLLVGICLLPVAIYAIETIKLTMNVKVEIEKGYEVGYYINEPVLLTDSELNEVIRTENTYCVVVYAGQSKYNYCRNIVIKDKKLYLAGESANLKELEMLTFIFPMREVVVPSKYSVVRTYASYEPYFPEDICTLRDDGSYVCPEENVKTITFDNWRYSLNFIINEFDSSYSENDKTIMNFGVIDDAWEVNGYFDAEAPQTFTMPEHNVLFKFHYVALE